MDATIKTTINTNLPALNNTQEVVKQPAPNIQTNQNTAQNTLTTQEATEKTESKYKIIQNPNVGVINLPFITKTPLTDTIELKSKEMPYTKYKTNDGKKKLFSLHTLAFGTTITCGILAFLSLFKKK